MEGCSEGARKGDMIACIEGEGGMLKGVCAPLFRI